MPFFLTLRDLFFFAYHRPWPQGLLQSEGFIDDAALDQAIKRLEADLKKTRKKAANDNDDGMVSTCFDPVGFIDYFLAGRALLPPS